MKLTNISISGYGPLEDFSFGPGAFDVIHGTNESGKTAIVEALAYVLFSRDVRSLRYGKPGSIAVEGEIAKKKFRLPSKKTEPAIPRAEIAGMLYVQASETALYRDETGPRFWDSVKLMMSSVGQKVPFARLGTKLLESAGLTAKGRWKENKQKTIDEKTERCRRLEEFLRELSKVEEMRSALAKKSAELEKVKREMDALKAAGRYFNYKKLRDSYSRYADKKNELASYERYDPKYFDEWQGLEAKKTATVSLAQKLREDEKAGAGLEKELADLKNTARIIDSLGLRSFTAATAEPTRPPSLFYALLVFFLGLMALILKFRFGYSYLYPAAVFAASLALFFVYQYRRYRHVRSRFAGEEWMNKAKVAFPDLRSLSDLPARLDAVEKGMVRLETLLSERKKTRDDLGAVEAPEAIEERIAELRRLTGLAELKQLKEKCARRTELNAELEGLRAAIESLLHNRDEAAWKRLIDELKCDPPAIPAGEGDPDEKARTHDRLKSEVDDARHKIMVFEESRYRVYGVNDAREAMVELRRLKEELADADLEKRAALEATEILNRMSGELDNLIEDIMTGGEVNLSRHFNRVTAGRYGQVRLAGGEFFAVGQDGREYKAGDLSSGTQDQLLLCFRMAALKKLYPDGCFLILDDAFIFADWQRRRRLAELLSDFSKDGNQVIYLTSDDHTRDLLQEQGAKITEIKGRLQTGTS